MSLEYLSRHAREHDIPSKYVALFREDLTMITMNSVVSWLLVQLVLKS